MPGSYLPETNEFDPQTDDFVISLLTKERRYLHFDLPLSKAERQQTTDFSRETSRHRFYPLLGFASTKRVLFKDSSGTLRQKTKVREIRYASHKDAAYLQAYTEYLSPKYERSLTANGLQESVLAYRRGGNSNIHHAKDLFDEISFRRECLFVGLDISGFFDTINHSTLKNELVNILANPHLEGHH